MPGVRFSMDSLNVARTRITNKLRNRGYYYFTPEVIEYLADTIAKPGKVILKMDLAKNVPQLAFTKYTMGDVTVRAFRYRGGGTPDTFKLDKVTLIQMMPSKLRHSIFNDNVTFQKRASLLCKADEQYPILSLAPGYFPGSEYRGEP